MLCLPLRAKAIIDERPVYFPADEAPSQTTRAGYAVQIGAFDGEGAAFALMAEARKKYGDKQTILRVLPRSYAPYLVWIVGFTSATEAREYIAAHKINGFVVENR